MSGMLGTGEDAADAAALALAALPEMGPARLRAVLARYEPQEAWARACGGQILDDREVLAVLGPHPRTLRDLWRAAAEQRGDLESTLERQRLLGVEMARLGQCHYPKALADDIEAPAVLFWLGEIGALDRRPRAAVVGTRNCTQTGAAVARELGADLANAGVAVVSGLAKGIDSAAHRGALRSTDSTGSPVSPVGVVGSGLDVVYPLASRELWRDLSDCGVLLSEAPIGTRPRPWRFPARNRIIAALADVLVVVESRTAGGSLHTVEEALRRDVPVMAVPGSVRSPASAGTNRLLHDGCAPARDALDVLVALGTPPPAAGLGTPAEEPLPGDAVLDALGGDTASLDQLALRSGLGLGELAARLQQLVIAGRVADEAGWYSRVR